MFGPYHSKLNTYFRALARKRGRGESRDSYRFRPGGQALIIILLVMSVSLLIGVGVSSRATSTLRQISFSEQSVRAYSFAEAGAEEALKYLKEGGSVPYNPPAKDLDGDGTKDFDYSIEEFGNEQIVTKFSPLERAKNIQINLENYSPDGDRYIHLYWVDSSKTDQKDKSAALVGHLVYLEGGVYKLKSYAFDQKAASRGNRFDWSSWGDGDEWCVSPGGKPDGTVTYQYRCRLKIPSGAKVLRLTPLYNDGVPNTFAIYAPSVLPHQGAVVASEGQSGQAKRKVEVIRADPALPGVFDFVYYSGSSL